MKKLIAFAATAALLAFGATAQEAEDPFADMVEMRHGLMLQMATDLGSIGAMAKGEAAYDAAVATKSAENIAAIASVLSMAQFPAGSEYEKAADSFALPAIWANEADFLQKIADLNAAAATLKAGAGTDLDTLKAGLGAVGGACAACHKAYRQPEA
jgi:cytochrome c556